MSVYAYPSETGVNVNLTQLYSDAKKSAPSPTVEDNVTSALADLHSEFAFQQKRLDEWGVQWSEEGKGPDGNIDETLARAGFTDTATGILGRILELNKEAAQIRTSGGAASQPWGVAPTEKQPSYQNPNIDISRYTDLIQELTDSIDILDEISRNRRFHIAGSQPSFEAESSTAGDYKGDSHKSAHGDEADGKSVRFAHSQPTFYDSHMHSASRRLGTPHPIDPSALILPPEGPPPYQNAGTALTTRMIGRLFRWQAPEPVRLCLQEYLDDPLVLIEYATFDPIHMDTGVSPPMNRLEQLAGYLQQASSQPQLNLLGYFQDPHTARLGLIYDITDCFQHSASPADQQEFQNVEQRSLLHRLQAASRNSKNADALAATPSLENRFKLAYHVAKHMEYMHCAAYTHGNLTSDSILFVTDEDGQQASKTIQPPVIGSFDLFSSPVFQAHADESGSNIYRYPDSNPSDDDLTSRLKRDIYGLGLILLEIGLWTPLSDLHKAKYQAKDFKTRLEKIWIPRLAVKCGSPYMSAVQACFSFSDGIGSTMLVSRHYDDIVDQLRRCCLICDDDGLGVSRPESRLSSALTAVDAGYHTVRSRGKSPGQQSVSSHRSRRSSRTSRSPSNSRADWVTALFDDGLSFHAIRSSAVIIQQNWRQFKQRKAERTVSFPTEGTAQRSIEPVQRSADTRSHSSQPKQKVFPCRLSPEHLAEWHSNLGLRISHIVERALKGSRESSTIELINVGPDEASSKPTILVTCSSTSLVKAAIKHRFRCDSSVYTVKVRKGTVNLSRKSDTPDDQSDSSRRRRRSGSGSDESATRSSADDVDYDSDEPELEARNPFFHERPLCGSSIGAYHEDLGHQDACTFGGIVLIDGRPYGMSVHHMLGIDDHEQPYDTRIDSSDDDSSFADNESEPDDDESIPALIPSKLPHATRSSARSRQPRLPQKGKNPSPGSDSEAEILSNASDVDFLSSSTSDTDSSSSSDVSLASDPESGSESDQPLRRPRPAGPVVSRGDTRGYRPYAPQTRAWRVTQPALDDAVDQDLHELDQDQLEIDDDHLREYGLGGLFASSGLHRHRDGAGFEQEIDWALFEIQAGRLQGANVVRGARGYCDAVVPAQGAGRLDVPLGKLMAGLSEFPGARVFAAGRTSGLATGRVHQARVRMKIEDREDFCWSWMVVPGETERPQPPLGASGDSGAWVVDGLGRVVGVVLAHASRSRVTYFCPMELVLEDVRRWLSVEGERVAVELPGLPERREVSPPDSRPKRSSLVVRSKVSVPPNVGMRSHASHAGGVRWRADAVPI